MHVHFRNIDGVFFVVHFMRRTIAFDGTAW